MKKILYFLILILGINSCSEDIIEPQIGTLPNYFKIANDNPNDPVQVKRYELYRDHGVSVFLNDTIAKVFVKISSRGDSVFRYERVDMNWGFTSNTIDKYRYDHTYLKTDAEKLVALGIAEAYLKSASAPLKPYCILLTSKTDRIIIKNGTPDLYDNFEIGRRALLLHNLGTYNTPVKIEDFVTLLKRQMVSEKLKNYEKELDAFGAVSDPLWYGKSWATATAKNGLGVVWDSSKVMRKYNASGVFTAEHKIELTAMRIAYKFFERDYPEESPEAIEELRQSPRRKIGGFGFVSSDKNNSLDSYSVSAELPIFLLEVLSTTREEFERRWGDSPLVMKKYEILYEIIKEKLEVEL